MPVFMASGEAFNVSEKVRYRVDATVTTRQMARITGRISDSPINCG
jgi:hypothetical protein